MATATPATTAELAIEHMLVSDALIAKQAAAVTAERTKVAAHEAKQAEAAALIPGLVQRLIHNGIITEDRAKLAAAKLADPVEALKIMAKIAEKAHVEVGLGVPVKTAAAPVSNGRVEVVVTTPQMRKLAERLGVKVGS